MVKSALVRHPVRELVTAIAAAADRWRDRSFPARVKAVAAIGKRTGYAETVVDYAVDQLFGSLTRNAIESTIAAELGSIDALDRFVDGNGARVRALPAGSVCIISSRTTIGVAILPAIFALCAKCDVLVKDREDDFVSAFFDSLARELAVFGEAARARCWDGEASGADLGAFDAVVAFGTDATLTQIAASIPFRARFIAYGSKASAGYVAHEALESRSAALSIAGGAARDLLLYDSEGCLSLHVLFVERGGVVSASEFAELLRDAIERERVEFPAAERPPQVTAAMAHARDLALFRDAPERIYSNARAEYLAVLDPPAGQAPVFLPWTLGIHSVDRPDEAIAYVVRHGVAIEAVAVTSLRDDIAEMIAAMGAARITSFGNLQSPPANARHGGRPRIAEFVRWLTDDR